MRKLLIAMLIALGAVSCGMPANAPARPGAEFYGVVYPFPTLEKADLPRLDRAHVKSVRWNFFWPTIEPSKGTFNWTQTDRMIGGLASHGIRVLPVLYGSPAYAGSKSTTPPIGSAGARDAWQDFLREAVQRYGPNGSFWTSPLGYQAKHAGDPVLPITEWQIWNEPNLKHYFTPRPSPRRYATLLRISHNAITGVDSGAKIVLAGMPGYGDVNAWTFLDRLYKIQGFRNDFDVAAIHPYAPNLHYLKREIRKMRAVLVKHGDRNKELDPTELGWGSHRKDRHGLNQGTKGQARLLKKSFSVLTRKHKAWNIGGLYWFEFRDPEKGKGGGCTFCDSAGLLKHNGHPKPSWRAYRHFTR
jgi:hypothetical protein